MLNNQIFLYFVVFLSIGCTNNIEEVNALVEKKDLDLEVAENIEILYSDSAIVKMKIIAPLMNRYTTKSNLREEWPDGIHVDFYNGYKRTNAWLDAKYAIRIDKENRIIVRDSVVLINNQGDILKSPELIWDQKDEILSTDKFVQIIQNNKQDTIYGYGFEADKDFSKFRIKSKFSTKRQIEI